MLTLRKPNKLDLPPLYNLAMDHASKFLDDYHSFNLEYAQLIIEDPDTIIVDDNGFAAGVVWFDDKVPELRASIHFLLRPEYWLKFYKNKLPDRVIQQTFDDLKLERIYAYPMDNQHTAIKILKRLGFFSHLPWRSNTRQQGKKRDVIFHELKRSNWSKRNGKR